MFHRVHYFIGLASILLNCLLIACSATVPEENISAAEKFLTIIVDNVPQEGFVATLPNGTTIRDINRFKQEMPNILSKAQVEGFEIKIGFGEYISREMNQTFLLKNPSPSKASLKIGQLQQPLGVPVFNYWLRVDVTLFSNPYVAGCVMRNVPVKGNVMVNQMIPYEHLFDLHLAAWTEAGGRPCFGAYESARNYINRCWCSPLSYDDIKDKIYVVALAAGLSATTAAIIAEIATPIIFSGLATI